MCGVVATCDPDRVVYRRDLNGRDLMFGTCRACLKLGDDWSRSVAAVLLDVPPDAVLLDGLRVDRFVDRPGVDPAVPNKSPWGHVNRTALQRQAEQAAAALEARTGGPCHICGSTLTPAGTTWTTSRQGAAQCGRCTAWFDGAVGGRFDIEDARIIAASVLLGHSTPNCRQLGPPGLASELSLTLFGESGLKRGTVEPFAFLDTAKLTARAVEVGIGTTVDPARWRAIDPQPGRRR